MQESRAARLRAAAAARAAHRPAVGPEHLKYRLPDAHTPRSRRSFFQALRLERQVIPAVNAARCAGDRGCDLCLRACPAAAIEKENGRAVIRPERCTGCGACAPACPTAAVRFPGFTPEEQSAGLQALLAPGPEGESAMVVAFVCPGGERALAAAAMEGHPDRSGALPVPVPCLGAVGVADLLECFALGAAAVALVGCGGGCRLGWDRRRGQRRADYVDRLLAPDGLTQRRVCFIDPVPGQPAALANALERFCAAPRGPSPGPVPVPSSPPAGPARIAALVRALAAAAPTAPAGARSRIGWAPLGQVKVDAERCTLCGLCAARCPCAALAFRVSAAEHALAFQPDLCVACGVCARACPEKVIAVRRAADPAALGQPPRVLARTSISRCGRCGRPMGPRRMLNQVGARMGRLAGLCPACRIGTALLTPRRL